jgi:hypothetical protein
MHGPFSYYNITLSCKEHTTALLSAHKGEIIAKVATNYFFNLNYFTYYMLYNTMDNFVNYYTSSGTAQSVQRLAMG